MKKSAIGVSTSPPICPSASTAVNEYDKRLAEPNIYPKDKLLRRRFIPSFRVNHLQLAVVMPVVDSFRNPDYRRLFTMGKFTNNS